MKVQVRFSSCLLLFRHRLHANKCHGRLINKRIACLLSVRMFFSYFIDLSCVRFIVGDIVFSYGFDQFIHIFLLDLIVKKYELQEQVEAKRRKRSKSASGRSKKKEEEKKKKTVCR